LPPYFSNYHRLYNECGSFLNWATIQILILGLVAFALDTVAGLLFGKLMSFLSKGTINPLIGQPYQRLSNAGRLVAQIAQEEDFENSCSCTPWVPIRPVSWERDGRRHLTGPVTGSLEMICATSWIG